MSGRPNRAPMAWRRLRRFVEQTKGANARMAWWKRMTFVWGAGRTGATPNWVHPYPRHDTSGTARRVLLKNGRSGWYQGGLSGTAYMYISQSQTGRVWVLEGKCNCWCWDMELQVLGGIDVFFFRAKPPRSRRPTYELTSPAVVHRSLFDLRVSASCAIGHWEKGPKQSKKPQSNPRPSAAKTKTNKRLRGELPAAVHVDGLVDGLGQVVVKHRTRLGVSQKD